MGETYANKEGNTFYSEVGGVGVVVTDVRGQTPALTPARKPTRVKDDDLDNQVINPITDNIASWGDDNLFPQRVLEFVRTNESLSSLLDWKLRALSSSELQYGRYVFDEDTKQVNFVREYIPEIEDFLECNNIEDTYLLESTKDLLFLGNIAPEIILNRDRSKVASLTRLDVSFFRKELQNKTTLRSEKGWLYSDWDSVTGLLQEGNATPLRIFEPRNNDVDIVQNTSGLCKFVYPCSYPKLGELYYAMAAWHPIMNSGWLELLSEIPKIKKKYFDNSLKLKYHVEIDHRYWELSTPNWKELDPQAQFDIKKEKADEIANKFAGAEGTGKAITTDMLFDNQQRDQWSLIKVTPLKNMLEDGILNEDSREAFSQLASALNIDTTLVSTPGKSFGGGSGSDKRLAWNIFMQLSKLDDKVRLKPLEFMAHYNGHKGLKFRLQSQLMATLNETTPLKRDITNE